MGKELPNNGLVIFKASLPFSEDSLVTVFLNKASYVVSRRTTSTQTDNENEPQSYW